MKPASSLIFFLLNDETLGWRLIYDINYHTLKKTKLMRTSTNNLNHTLLLASHLNVYILCTFSNPQIFLFDALYSDLAAGWMAIDGGKSDIINNNR